jgi:hypothetical protein
VLLDAPAPELPVEEDWEDEPLVMLVVVDVVELLFDVELRVCCG